jgi:uncharacterized protein (TIGR03067 family)
MNSSTQSSEVGAQKPEPSEPGLAAEQRPPSAGTASDGGRARRVRYSAAGAALLAVAAAAIWYFAVREPSYRNDAERFQGEWRITLNGRETPNAVRVEGEHWEYIASTTGVKAYRFRLNEAADPKEIDLELIDTAGLRGAPVRMHGIYRFDGNRSVKVVMAPGLEPRPRSIDDAEQPVLELRRVKLDRDPQPGK